MTTQQQFFTDSTPLNKHIVKALGLVKGAVACKIIYASSLRDGVCRMGLSRMADELGIDKSTVSKNITWLKKEGWVNLLLAASDTHPAHLKPSEKLMDLLDTVDDINPPVDKVNTPVDDINQDKSTNKKTNKPLTSNEVSPAQKSTAKKRKAPIKEKEVRPPAVDTYRSVANRFPDKATWSLLEQVTDLEFWEQVIRDYIACGWNKTNIKAMKEFYDRRELPAAKKNGAKNGKTHQQNNTKSFERNRNAAQERLDRHRNAA